MSAIELQLSDQSVTIRRCNEASPIKWSGIVESSVVKMIINKAAVVLVYSSDGEFKFPEINAKTWKSQPDNRHTYFLAACNSWTKNDIEEIATLMEFELSAAWFNIVSELDETKIDPVKFYESIDEIILGKKEETEFQCVGSIADGREIVWKNPDWTTFDDWLTDFKNTCSLNDLELDVKDHRDQI